MEERELRKIHLKKIYELISQPEIQGIFKLTQKEKSVLELFLGNNLNFKEIGDTFGFSGEAIRQIYEKAARKIILSIQIAYGEHKMMQQLIEENKRLRDKAPHLLHGELSKSEITPSLKELLKTPITDINFSARTFHCLATNEIETIEDLLKYSKKELLKLRNLGAKSVKEIEFELQTRGLQLRK